jgi:hypothetical protein
MRQSQQELLAGVLETKGVITLGLQPDDGVRFAEPEDGSGQHGRVPTRDPREGALGPYDIDIGINAESAGGRVAWHGHRLTARRLFYNPLLNNF